MPKQRLTKPQLRLLAYLPLAFFFAQAVHYWEINQLGHIFWMCNIGNLVLAIGIFLEKPVVVRVAAIWGVPGLIVWCIYVVPTWGTLITGQFNWSQLFGVTSSSMAHLGGLTIGLVALQKVGMDSRAWLYAYGWYFVMQLISRLVTPAPLNVNLSHRVQDGFEQAFPTYWKFWVLLSLMVGICTWLVSFVLHHRWPMKNRKQHTV